MRGRLKEKAEEDRLKKEKAAIPERVKDQYALWSKGMSQAKEQGERVRADLHEMSKPLARDADDADLNDHLRDADRQEDPMLAYVQKKRKQAVANSNIERKHDNL